MRALGLVVLLAALLRVVALDRCPPALHPDEAANAVDARALPGGFALAYDHEAGWVEGTYVWLAGPAMALADATGAPLEAGLRWPAALAGLAMVPALWVLGRSLGGKSAGMIAALLAAVAPWAVHHSRLGLRATLIAPLVAWGVVWLLRAEESGRPRPALVGGLLLGLAAATYPPARLALPALVAVWLLAGRERWDRRRAALALVPCALALVALLPWMLGPSGGQRLRDVLTLGNGPLDDVRTVARGWALHLGPRMLWSGASSRGFAPEGVGLFPLATAPLFALGILALLVRKTGAAGGRDAWRVRLLAWLVIAPLPAALTKGVPDPLRAGLLLPALVLLAALGASWLVCALPRGIARRAVLAAIAGVIVAQGVIGFARYVHVHATRETAFYRAGRREAVQALATLVASGHRIRITAPFMGAYLRLYAPDLPARREPDGAWIVGGEGAPTCELVLIDEGLPVQARHDHRAWIAGVAWLGSTSSQAR